MNTISRVVGRSGSMFAALAFLVAVSAPAFVSDSASAGQLSPRKLTLTSSAPGNVSTDANGATVAKGSGGNGAFAGHTYNWTFGTSGASVGSIALQYCTTPLFNTACTAPTGLDAATVASIVTQSGFAAGAFSLDTTTVANTGGIFGTAPCSGTTPFRQNCILLKRTAAVTETGTPAVTLAFGQGTGTDWVKNPTSTGTFYVRVHVFSDLAYTTTVDDGGVAASIATQIDITAKVQEKLNFSVAAASVAAGTSCAPLTGSGSLTLGDPTEGVLAIETAYDAHSYFRVNTNAAGGTNILYSGDTLKTKDGTNSIAALTTTAVSSTPGTAQFGLAINTANTGHTFTNLSATAPYAGGAGTINPSGGTALFAFDTTSVTAPKQIAGVSNQTIACDTGAVRYLGNISTTTRAGVYKTTITYIAVPTF